MMYFSVITINPKDAQISLDNMNKIVRMCAEKVLPITYIDYSTFKSHTESKPTPIYIMEKKNNKRLEQIKDITTMKQTYSGTGIKLADYKAPIDQTSDPRYMILDTHKIKVENAGIQFAVRLAISPILPISLYVTMNEIAKLLSKEMIVEVFSISKELTCDVEAISRWENSKCNLNNVTRIHSGVIAKYTKANNISINEILGQLDDNIDKLMAPKDMVEYENMIEAFNISKKFMEEQKITNSTEYFDTISQIKEAEEDLLAAKTLIKQEPNVVSNYIRVYNPQDLEKYRIREVNLNANIQKDFWGKLK